MVDRAQPLTLIPDAAAALFAVRANPGIPARGTVAVCDFGGSGTSITLDGRRRRLSGRWPRPCGTTTSPAT